MHCCSVWREQPSFPRIAGPAALSAAPSMNIYPFEIVKENAEQYAYLSWHVNSETDPGHKWLRESMMQAIRTNQ
jgi:hypothetical protein